MTARSVSSCTHELRPGTTVCLRCQHAERAAKRAKQRRVIARSSAGILGLGVLAAMVVAGASVLRSRVRSNAAVASSDNPADSSSSPVQSDSLPSAPVASAASRGLAGATVAAAASVTSAPSVPLAAPGAATRPDSATPAPTRHAVVPIVPVGRTALRDTMVAERAGDTVRVRFDLLLARTRRPEKFEAIMRATLPQVYGAAADSALRVLPAGVVARAGDLVTMLPERGIQIPLASGHTIAVWPETRAGRDGPLVVAYRAVASR